MVSPPPLKGECVGKRFELRRHYVWQMEVFLQDWKSYEGWSQLTKQPGDEGARHSVILSLLVDHSLFMHPDQQRQLKNNLPAYTYCLPSNDSANILSYH